MEDWVAIQEGWPILVVDLSRHARDPFRCWAKDLYVVENNLNLANMDWEEFAEQVDESGIFRGLG